MRGNHGTTSSAPTTLRYGHCWTIPSSVTFWASTVAGTPSIRRAGTRFGARPTSRGWQKGRCTRARPKTACLGPRSCGHISGTSSDSRGGRLRPTSDPAAVRLDAPQGHHPPGRLAVEGAPDSALAARLGRGCRWTGSAFQRCRYRPLEAAYRRAQRRLAGLLRWVWRGAYVGGV